ncbi:MAG: hypothetical protein ABSF56_00265 [Minisyncoccia bacterium]|jgi:hypothetical protein
MNRYLRLASVAAVCAYFWYYAKTYTEWHFIDNANLVFHEAGHAIFFFLGMFVKIAAGSGFQVALPLFISLYFFVRGQKISGALCLLWVGQNLLNVSVYAGDAVNMQLNLLGGDAVIHDWNYLLSALGVLRYTSEIASTIYMTGLATIFLGTVLSLYYSWVEESRS